MVGLQRYISTIWRTACMYSNNKSSAVAEMGDRLSTIDMGRNCGPCPFLVRGAEPHLTQSPGPRPTCMPSFIFIHPTVWWPQCTNVTDRQTGQDRAGQDRTTVRQHWAKPSYRRSLKNHLCQSTYTVGSSTRTTSALSAICWRLIISENANVTRFTQQIFLRRQNKSAEITKSTTIYFRFMVSFMVSETPDVESITLLIRV